MGFYDLSKKDRTRFVHRIKEDILEDLRHDRGEKILSYFSDPDTHIRQKSYLSLGKIYREKKDVRGKILALVKDLSVHNNDLVRQTVVHSCGEIGKLHPDEVLNVLEKALDDRSWKVRNAVVGSLKQMGDKNPGPALKFAGAFIKSKDPKVRREAIHGMELRGRTHPQDVLPLLEKLQSDLDKDVQKTVIHVLGQISYKKGCLEKVVSALKTWENKDLVKEAANEILKVHERYDFSEKTFDEAERLVRELR